MQLNPVEAPDKLGDTIRLVAISAIREVNENYEGIVKLIESKVQTMRTELQYEHANPLDRLVIEQVLTAWVQWYIAGILFDADLSKNRSWRENQYYTKRYKECQTRLTKSIEQLAKIRQISSHDLHIITPEDIAEQNRENELFKAEYEARSLKMKQEIEEDIRREQAEEDED